MWVARDPMGEGDGPDYNYPRRTPLTDKDIRVDPNKGK